MVFFFYKTTSIYIYIIKTNMSVYRQYGRDKLIGLEYLYIVPGPTDGPQLIQNKLFKFIHPDTCLHIIPNIVNMYWVSIGTNIRSEFHSITLKEVYKAYHKVLSMCF